MMAVAMLTLWSVRLGVKSGHWQTATSDSVKVLEQRVTQAEDWIKELRRRSHEHTNQFQSLPVDLRDAFVDKEVYEVQVQESREDRQRNRADIDALWRELRKIPGRRV